MKKKVSIVVLNWNGKKLLKDCLESIKKNTKYPNYEVIVVDNGSKDGSVEMLKEMKGGGYLQKLILNNENKGFSYANNQGFDVADGEYYFMLNNDTVVKENWLTNAVKVAESDPKIAAVGSRLIDAKPYSEGKYKLGKNQDKLTLCGAAMLMKKEVVDKIGKLDADNFSPIYGEETDWCYRAKNSGYRLVETDSSLIIHMGSVDTKRQTGREWQYTLMNTHRLKAMLYNLSVFDFLKHVPGLGQIFVNSLKDRSVFWLLKSYWSNIMDLRNILRERKKRKKIAERIRKGLAS